MTVTYPIAGFNSEADLWDAIHAESDFEEALRLLELLIGGW